METSRPDGKVLQVIGPVVDVEFPGGSVPQILHALEIDRGELDTLVLEVQQHLGENRVRNPRPTPHNSNAANLLQTGL